jgi:FAD binding domain
VPRTIDAAVAAVAVCRDHEVPLLSRGGGTSLAGQCTNAAAVLDFSKYCHRVVFVDPERRRCVVEPGIVLDVLNERLAEHGLRYGPKPATHPNCTLGGMIGNNSCGATAQRTGKVVDNTPRLEVLLYDGTRFWCGRTDDEEFARIASAGGALVYCLACKGCRSGRPVNVDMATHKAEFLAHHYGGRLRARHAYALGALPAAAQAVGRLGLASLPTCSRSARVRGG